MSIRNLIEKIYKSEWWFLAVVTALVIYVRLRHIDIAFERDEGEYTYAAQEILRGRVPYLDFYNMKLPGVYYFFAFIFSLFPHTAFTVKITLLVVNLINAFLVYLVAQSNLTFTKTQNYALTAAAIYLLFSLSFEAQGWTANAEHFVILPALMGIVFFQNAYFKKSNGRYFLSGCLLSWAFISKQHAVGYLLIPPLWLGSLFYFEQLGKRNFAVFTKQFLMPLLLYAMGGLLVFSALLYYFYSKNALSALYFFTFDYASAYVAAVKPFAEIWHFRPIFWNSPLFFALIFVAIYIGIRKHKVFAGQYFLWAFLLGCFICIHPGWYYRPHYFQLLFPGAAILSAFTIQNMSSICNKTPFFIHKNSLRWLGLLATLTPQYGYFFTSNSADVTNKMYQGSYFNEVKMVAQTLPSMMRENGTIGIIGAEPQILFYAKKESATGFLYHFPIYEKHKFAVQMADTLTAQLARNKPEIFIYFKDLGTDGAQNEVTQQRIALWSNDFLTNYSRVGIFFAKPGTDFSHMRWYAQDTLPPTDFVERFSVWKRKTL